MAIGLIHIAIEIDKDNKRIFLIRRKIVNEFECQLNLD